MAKKSKQSRNVPPPRWPAVLPWAALALSVLALPIFKINDYDIWWHLRTGQWILQNLRVPHADFYSYTIAGHVWITFEWLSQVVFYGVYAAAGAAGLTLFKTAVLALSFLCIAAYACVGEDAVPARTLGPAAAPYLAAFIALAACGARVSFVERPQIFTFLLTAVFLLVLKASETRPKLIWSLPLLEWLWANLHGGASIVGLVLIGGWGTGLGLTWYARRAADSPEEAAARGRALTALGLVWACAAAVSLLTPNTWRIYSQLFGTLDASARDVISEWGPLTFTRALSPIWVPLVLLEAVSAWAWAVNPKRRFGEGLLWLAFLLLSFRALRFTAQAVFVFAQLGAGNLASVLKDREPKPRVALLASALSAAAILGGSWLYATYAYPGVFMPGLGVSRDSQDAIAFLSKEGLKGNLFNSYELGGQLIWEAPGRPVFVDGRSLEYGSEFVRDAMTWFRPAVWKQLDSRWNFQIAIIENGAYYLCGVLDDDPAWSLVYWDDQALVYVRNDGLNADVAKRLGYHYLKPNQTDFSYLDAAFRKNLMAFPMALSEVERSIKAAPKNVNTHLLEAYLMRRAGKSDDALKQCLEAMAIAPDRPEPYYQAGLLLQSLNRLDEAQTRYNEAMERAFRFGDVGLQVQSLNNLGVIAYKRGDKAAAAALWHKALVKDPENAAARHNLGAVGEAG